MNSITGLWMRLTELLDRVGDWLPALMIRLLLGYEYFESGLMKYRGGNWFAQIQDQFPFPFHIIHADISWFLATWSELIGAVMIIFGLFTRFWAFSLIILTIVATAAVHWPDSYSSLGELLKGYAITNKGYGNYKLPVLYLVLFLPLLFSGAGTASLDHFLRRRFYGV
jgi:putative oxidoreductase